MKTQKVWNVCFFEIGGQVLHSHTLTFLLCHTQHDYSETGTCLTVAVHLYLIFKPKLKKTCPEHAQYRYIKPLTLSAFLPGFVRLHKDTLTRKWSDVLPGQSDSGLAQFHTYTIKKRKCKNWSQTRKKKATVVCLMLTMFKSRYKWRPFGKKKKATDTNWQKNKWHLLDRPELPKQSRRHAETTLKANKLI